MFTEDSVRFIEPITTDLPCIFITILCIDLLLADHVHPLAVPEMALVHVPVISHPILQTVGFHPEAVQDAADFPADAAAVVVHPEAAAQEDVKHFKGAELYIGAFIFLKTCDIE